MRSSESRIHVVDPEHRTFVMKDQGALADEEVSVEVTALQRSMTGKPDGLVPFNDTRTRIYQKEMRVLRNRRQFVQYRPDDRDENGRQLDGDERHCRALNDIRFLIEQHGQTAVWLWDPYLNAQDILRTLFYNPHAESAMKALTGAEQIEVATEEDGVEQCYLTGKGKFIRAERNTLEHCSGNLRGLSLEFRARIGGGGFAFHDRFLIFPHPEPEPRAWSLGTSVNSAGRQHHILQLVPHGRLIADAFEELWNELNQDRHLVWKTP